MSDCVDKLYPDLRRIAWRFLEECRVSGLPVRITDTLRTRAAQNALYAKGRLKRGEIVTRHRYPMSGHCWGVAFDICRDEADKEYDDSDGFFGKCGAIGKRLGLFWGGDSARHSDIKHFEMPQFMPYRDVSGLLHVYGTPRRFIKIWGGSKQWKFLNNASLRFKAAVRRLWSIIGGTA